MFTAKLFTVCAIYGSKHGSLLLRNCLCSKLSLFQQKSIVFDVLYTRLHNSAILIYFHKVFFISNRSFLKKKIVPGFVNCKWRKNSWAEQLGHYYILERSYNLKKVFYECVKINNLIGLLATWRTKSVCL